MEGGGRGGRAGKIMKFGRWTFVVFVVVLLAGSARPAHAWGPGTHVGLGVSVLEELGLLPASIAALLARNTLAYLYGNIAADVVFAKRLSRVKQFCHHWATGFRLLEKAEDDGGKAFALGYLSHLAADTVAHGKFVPRQLTAHDCTMNFGHFYWELRADALQTPATWDVAREVIQEDHSVHHQVLAAHLTDTFLTFDMNRALFERMNAIASLAGFRRTMGLWGRLSRWKMPIEFVNHYQSESVERILTILSQGDRSALLHEDPNGTAALIEAKEHRKRVRRLRRAGVRVDRRHIEMSGGFAPAQPSRLAVISGPEPTIVSLAINSPGEEQSLHHAP